MAPAKRETEPASGQVEDLAGRFLRAATPEAAETPEALTRLRQSLEAVIETARLAWPEIDVPDRSFVDHLATLAPAESASLEAYLERLPGADLWLACGALSHQPQALAALHQQLEQLARDIGRRMGRDAAAIEDAGQRVEERLVVGSGGQRPGLASYAGRASLRAFMRVAVVRELVRQGQHHRREILEDALEVMFFASDEGAEAELMKAQIRRHFRAAVRAAIADLTARQRSLLRYAVADGVQLADLCRIYSVDRTTIWRWLKQTRRVVMEGTLQLLGNQLKGDTQEVHSALRLIRSRLSVTISDLLDTESMRDAGAMPQ